MINFLVCQFDQTLKENYKDADLSNSYSAFFSRLRKAETVNEFVELLNFICENKEVMLKNLNRESFLKIWNKSTINGNLSININGEFINFLNGIADNNPIVKEYYNMITIAGDISPSAISYLVDKQGELELDPHIRFILTVHYLSICK